MISERVYITFRLLRSYFSIVFHAWIAPVFWWYRRAGRLQEVQHITDRMIKDWSHELFASMGCRVEIEGAQHVPLDTPLVVMANHQSLYDIPLLMGYLGRQAGFVAKKELFRIPGLAYWMRHIHSVSLDRADPRAGLALYDRLGRDIIAERYCYIVFPEGTRSRDPQGRIGPFRQGALRLASDHHIPVLPLTLDGTRLLGNGAALARSRAGGRVIRIRIAPPILPRGTSSLARKQLMEQVREIIVSNWEEIRVDWPVLADAHPIPAAHTVAHGEAAGSAASG